jgi:rubrerythrin
MRRRNAMGKNAATVALEKALELEQQGLAFYTGAAERTVNETGKEMYRSLADDEVLHARMIQRQLDALAGGEGWQAPGVTAEGEVDLDSPLFPEGKEGLAEAVRPDASDRDALLFALKIENDSFALYQEQAKTASDLNAKQMFEYLAAAERTHFNLLMSNFESLERYGGWV